MGEIHSGGSRMEDRGSRMDRGWRIDDRGSRTRLCKLTPRKLALAARPPRGGGRASGRWRACCPWGSRTRQRVAARRRG
eukprot:2528104-Pyramimonas_sp.AAC.1